MISEAEWESEVESEINFWKTLIDKEGKGFGHRFARKEAIPEFLPDLVDLLPSPGASIADIGCGPVPIVIGGNYRRPVRIVGCDPLSARYVEIMKAHGITPTVELHSVAGERLLDVLERESFDVSHIRNALDHSFDPLQIVSNMVDITKPGGIIVVRNIVNEGMRQKYEGLHQWNISPGFNDFYISNRHGDRFSARSRLGSRASSILTSMHQDVSRANLTWMDVVIIKAGATHEFERAVEATFFNAQAALLEKTANLIRASSRPKTTNVSAKEPAAAKRKSKRKRKPITTLAFNWLARARTMTNRG